MNREKQKIHQSEKIQSEKVSPITIIIDSGERASHIGRERSIRFAMESGGNSVVTSSNDHPVDLSEYDPMTTLVIMASSTVDYSRYENSGFTVYPSQENLSTVSDKWHLYEQLRRLNIPTVLTLPVSHKRILKDGTKTKLSRLNEALKGSIVKPKNTSIQRVRAGLRQIYRDTDDNFSDYSTGATNLESDLVLQERLEGVAMKAFGAWPDQFFYQDETKAVRRCPPNISRLCKLVCEEFDVRFGGFDFMVKEDQFGNKIWLLMDINPPSGGRKIGDDDQIKMNSTINHSLHSVLGREEIPKSKQKVVTLIAAAGEGSRMKEITQGSPKSLLEVSEDGSTPLDYNLGLARLFSGSKIRVFTKRNHFDQFSSVVPEDIDVIIPDENITERDSSYNHALASLPKDSNLVLMMAADRVNIFPEGLMERVAQTARKALEEEGMPYILIGIKDNDSKHRYVTDPNGRILEYKREEDSPQTGVGIKKVAFGWDVAKVPVISARNTYQVVQAQLDNGSLGKLIIIDPEIEGEVTSFDIDTPEEFNRAKSILGN